MSYSNLAAINNACAAKTARERKTPYVPWNTAETRETGFIHRIPNVAGALPGWFKITGFRGTVDEIKKFISSTVNIYGGTLGFGFIGPGVVAAFEALPEAHEGIRSEGRRPPR